MEIIGNSIMDDNGHEHKVKGYDVKHDVYIIIEDHIDLGQTRVVIGYDNKKKSFVLIFDNVELGTQRIDGFEPWAPFIYEDWECMTKYK